MPDEYLDWMHYSDLCDQEAEHNERRERFQEHNSVWAAPRQGAAARPFDEAASEARHAKRQAEAARNRQQIREALEEHGRQRTLSLFSHQEGN